MGRVIACSRWVQRELALEDVPAECMLLPVRMPGPDFRRAPATEPVFVLCGRLDRNKGVGLLVRAFATLKAAVPAARLRVVGDGPDRAGLERLVWSLGLSGVDFRGSVAPRRGGAGEFQRVGAGGAVALGGAVRACGARSDCEGGPVIGSAAGGLGEVIEHGTSGLLFPDGNEPALLTHLLAVARGEVFPSRILPAEVVSHAQVLHSPARYIQRLRGLFEEMVSGPTHRRPAAR